MVSLNYKLIKAKKSDFDRIYKARETVPTVDNFKYEKYKLFWHWLFFNSLNRLHFILIAVHKNKVKGHLGLVPINFLKKNKQCTGGLYCQLFVENAFRNTSLFFDLERGLLKEYKNNGFDFVYALVNIKQVLKAHLAFGFKKIGTLSVYARPVRLKNILLKKKFSLLYYLFFPFITIIEFLIKNYQYKDSAKNIIIETVPSFPKDIDLLNELLIDEMDLFPSKDSKSLNWRFSNTPVRDYKIHIIKARSKLIGYFVSRETTMKNFKVMALVDVVLTKKNKIHYQAILNHLNKLAVESEADLVATISKKNDYYTEQLNKNLFFNTNNEFTLIAHGLKNKNVKSEFDKWQVSWFDHDVV